MSRENVEMVRAVFEEWARGNLAAGQDLYAPDVVYIPHPQLPEARRCTGHEEIKNFVMTWLESMGDFALMGEEFLESGDTVVVGVHQSGVGRDSRAATEVRYFEAWTFRGARVIRREVFLDRAEALETAGLSE